jgi:hypothetical protein
VDRGQEDGLIESEAAHDLDELADDVAKAVEDGTQGDVNRAFRDLRRAVDEFDRDGRIDSDIATRLREAVDEIESAAGR